MKRYSSRLAAGMFAAAVMVLLSVSTVRAQTNLITNGVGHAQIVIAPKPPRMVTLAANQLQTYLQRISGAKLPIVHKPASGQIAIYVGRSQYTEKLGISTAGLYNGAFRLVSGKNWLALIGIDQDYQPGGPWARSHSDETRFFKAWDKLTGHHWGNPIGASIFRQHSKKFGWWALDKRGSLNAVYQFLRDLGVRWYMPGPLGEIVPHQTTIALPKVDRTVRPDFGMRCQMHSFYFLNNRENILWYLRLGLNWRSHELGYVMMMPHGLRYVTQRRVFQKAHPSCFAIYNGKRMDGSTGDRFGKPRLSSPVLFDQTIDYMKAMINTYHVKMVSAMPTDGFTIIGEHDRAQATPQRGFRGSMSDYVWGFVNRVAKRLYKIDPKIHVICSAYGTYHLPPEHIKHLSPNVVVAIAQRRMDLHNPAIWKKTIALRQTWLKLSSSGKIMNDDHYPYTRPGKAAHGIPEYFPHTIAKDLRWLKGRCYGEFIETGLSAKRHNEGLGEPIFAHLNSYVTARLEWNADQNVDALLDQYYRLFYGPAAGPMKTFVDYCENHLDKLHTDPKVIAKVLSLIDQAQAHAPKGTRYRQRIDKMVTFLTPMKELLARLKEGHKNVPVVRAHVPRNHRTVKIKIDGKFNEPYWQHLQPVYHLRNLLTGRKPVYATTFRVFWQHHALYFAIHCQEPGKPASATTKNDDPSIWNGDDVEIFLETPSHSYYQICVDPAGAVMDLDRAGGQIDWKWSSQADVACTLGKGYWNVEARIPVIGPQAGADDPLHEVVGNRPSKTEPWYFNVGRQRIRNGQKQAWDFSPTGKKGFNVISRFAKLYTK